MNTVELARAAGVHPLAMSEEYISGLERLVALVRAAERNACLTEFMFGRTTAEIKSAILARGSKE